jgi:EpsI family protein
LGVYGKKKETLVQAIWQSKYVRVLTLVLLVQAVLFYNASHGDSRPLRQPLVEFPRMLQGWQAVVDGVVDEDTRSILKADDVLSRFYARTPVPDIDTMTPEAKMMLQRRSYELFLEYFSTQQQGQSPHSPKNCLPGSGWQPTETGEMSISVPGWPVPLNINKYMITKGEESSLVLYWYQSHGRVVANEFSAKFYLVTDSMRYHRSDTSLIRVVVPVREEGPEVALKNATDLVQAAFPAVLKYFPQ